MLYEVKRMVGVHDLDCLDNMVIFDVGSIYMVKPAEP